MQHRYVTTLRYSRQAMGRPKEHDEATRAALLTRAGQLLRSEGPGSLSLRRVAADVGTTTRAVYSLFGGKNGLLSAMYREMGDTLTRLHAAVPEQRDVVAELLQLCLAYRQSVRQYPTLYPLLFDSVPGFAPSALDREEARRGFVRVLATLERGIAEGRFKGRAADDMGHELWALVHGLASLEIRGVLGRPKRAKRLWQDATSNLIAGFAWDLDEGPAS
jgi:AcrR family transcriptional regulator